MIYKPIVKIRISCKKFTIGVQFCPYDFVIKKAPLIANKFIGRSLFDLLKWVKKLDKDYRVVYLDRRKINGTT